MILLTNVHANIQQENEIKICKSPECIENQSHNTYHHTDIQNRPSQKTAKNGLPKGWTRATFILREEHVEQLKAISYWDRKTIKEIMDQALSDYLKNKELNIFIK